MHHFRTIPTIMLLLALAACAQQAGEPSPSAPGTESAEPTRPVSDASPIPVPSNEGDTVTGEVPADILADILADATRRTGEPTESLEVVTAAAVTWNDGSLGCPEPGQFYTQALVDGYQVVIRVADEELDYRVGNGDFRLCENPTAPGATKPSG
jgi:hypothetical protein